MNAINFYRVERFCYLHGFTIIAKIIQLLIRIIFNSYIPYTADIGKNSTFAYGGIGIVIHGNTIIGKNCSIGQGITIGGRGIHGGPPIIGDDVFIAAGARLLGKFSVGNKAVIGANAVVIKDIPPGGIVGGIPAKLIKIREMNDNANY